MKIHIEGATPEQAAQLEKYAKLALGDQNATVTIGSLAGSGAVQGGYIVTKIDGTAFYAGQMVKLKSDAVRRFVAYGSMSWQRKDYLAAVEITPGQTQPIAAKHDLFEPAPASEFAVPKQWNW